MKVVMKKYELKANQHARKFAKSWDYYTVDTSAYMSGYLEGKRDTGQLEETVEVDLKDGEHQLCPSSFDKWSKEVKNLSFKEALTQLLCSYEFTQINYDVDRVGNISFQGVAKKK